MTTIGQLHDRLLSKLSFEQLEVLERELWKIPKKELLKDGGIMAMNRQWLLAGIYEWKDRKRNDK